MLVQVLCVQAEDYMLRLLPVLVEEQDCLGDGEPNHILFELMHEYV